MSLLSSWLVCLNECAETVTAHVVVSLDVLTCDCEVAVELHLLTCYARTLSNRSLYRETVRECESLNSVEVCSLSSNSSVENLLSELDIVSVVSNEVCLTLEGDDSSETVTNLSEYTTVCCLTVSTLCSDSLTLLTEDILSLIHIALSLCESLLYISKSCASHSAELLDGFHCNSHIVSLGFKN